LAKEHTPIQKATPMSGFFALANGLMTTLDAEKTLMATESFAGQTQVKFIGNYTPKAGALDTG